MTAKLFYEKAPLILSIVGLSFGPAGYYLERYFSAANIDIAWVIWSTIALILAIFGLWVGRLLKRLDMFASEDSLTGLLNRRKFCKVLEIQAKQQSRVLSGLCLALVDIDNFKAVNDRYGHSMGDSVLKSLSHLFAKNIRAYDTIARWGGDEFVILLPDTQIGDAWAVVDRMKQAVAQEEWDQDLTISVGLVAVSPNASVEQVFRLADQALYRAKQKKNTVVASA